MVRPRAVWVFMFHAPSLIGEYGFVPGTGIYRIEVRADEFMAMPSATMVAERAVSRVRPYTGNRPLLIQGADRHDG